MENEGESGLDLSDLDLSAIQFSDKEMKALSGLTPALSRRLQRQLLAHLPPAAARSLRRTLSLNAAPRPDPPPAHAYARSHSAGKSAEPDAPEPEPEPLAADPRDTDHAPLLDEPSCPLTPLVEPESPTDRDPIVVDASASQYCTLPRIRRRSTPRDVTPPISPEADSTGGSGSRSASARGADRPLLSKYLTPERNLSLDDSYSSDGGSILSEPSYIAAYGPGSSGQGFRRHSLRLTGDQPRKRISRFLRSDFFDSPTDESLYAKHKKEKELETQKILREIRDKKKALDATAKSPTDALDAPTYTKEDPCFPRKSVSPISLLTGKDRSRSNTPFFPILDNIKETTLDTSLIADPKLGINLNNTKQSQRLDESSKDSKLIRPKSYPVKTLDSIDEPCENVLSEISSGKENHNKDRTLQRESKLMRPKSYPTSSPSPEKVYVNRNVSKMDDTKVVTEEGITGSEIKSDVEVTFSITLPKKVKADVLTKQNSPKSSDVTEQSIETKPDRDKTSDSLVLKKYKIIDEGKSESPIKNNGKSIANGITSDGKETINRVDANYKTLNNSSKKEVVISKSVDSDSNEKKGTIKKKIIKKVSSKSKTDLGSSQDAIEVKGLTEKKKVTKKAKDKTADDGTKTNVTKKKSVLQSIGHKLEKFASSKSSSPEKVAENNSLNHTKKENNKLCRTQREQSVPVNVEPPSESNLIKRAVTLTDVAALDSPNVNQNKTTVSKVLGLFKKFEPKDKTKNVVEKSPSENISENVESRSNSETLTESVLENVDKDKPRRPTSLLLNGLGRKNKYGRTSSDSVSALSTENTDLIALKKENEPKNIRNSLKLDFSRLPRVKKIVPTNPVIEPQIMNVSSVDDEKKNLSEKKAPLIERNINADSIGTLSRSRSRSRSTISNSEIKSDQGGDTKLSDKNPVSPSDNSTHLPFRNHESTTPEKEDVVDRIRRKSFYSRFNEKKQRRKSSLVGPGATEYDPVARIHSQPTETKFDISPTSPGNYDLSPGISVSSDISPSTERYRSLIAELPSTRNNLRFDNYGLNDKIDTYRSLDRNDFRKYPSSRSYMDYDQPTSYGTHRYSRTKSLLDGPDGTEDSNILNSMRDPLKYNRTISMYTPGNYATYRPKRTRNSAIILKESEKEPSPENILDKIRQRKNFSISVTRKPDSEKDPLPRSTVSSKGESNGTECSEKVD